MHQPFLIVNALLEGNHGLCPAYAFNIVYLEYNILGMRCVFCPDLAKDIELTSGNMCYGNVRNLR